MGDPHDRLKVVCARDRDLARACGTVLRPPSAVSSFGGFRTPAAEHAAPSLKRPASETLHISAKRWRSAYPPQACKSTASRRVNSQRLGDLGGTRRLLRWPSWLSRVESPCPRGGIQPPGGAPSHEADADIAQGVVRVVRPKRRIASGSESEQF
jgi:hypothetical protein